MLACHAGGPGSIPGRCSFFLRFFPWAQAVKTILRLKVAETAWVNIDYWQLKGRLEAPGIDPGTSRMLSERSTIWATPPDLLAMAGFIALNKEL